MDIQATYFDQPAHQFVSETLLHPSPHHILEYQHLLSLFKPTKKANIVDFGSGSGRLTLFLLQQGYHVTAVDISQNSLKQLESLYLSHRQSSWGHLKTTTTLPQNLDYILGTDILHHLDLPKVLPKLYHSLKPGGKAVFSEPNGLNPLWYAFLIAKRIPWHIERNLVKTTLPNLSRQFQAAGFSDISTQGHGALPTPLIPTPANKLLGNLPLLKHVSFRLLITAAKPSQSLT